MVARNDPATEQTGLLEPGADDRSRVLIIRNSPSAAGSVISQIYPDPVFRRKCLTVLASAIELAHRMHPACWAVTLGSGFIRLNVGKLEICVLRRSDLYIVFDVEQVHESVLIELRSKATNEVRIGSYSSMPTAAGVRLKADSFDTIWPLIAEAHAAAIERCAAVVKTRTTFWHSHSPGVIAFLRQELGREIPDPAYHVNGLEVSGHVTQSKKGLDRSNSKDARRVIERLCPDPGVRGVCLALLADAIEMAHRIQPNCWSVTLHSNLIRLNVGHLVVVGLYRSRLSFLVDKEQFSEEAWSELQSRAGVAISSFIPKTSPMSRWVIMPPDQAEAVWPLIAKAHASAVERCATLTKTRTPEWWSHAPEVIVFLRQELGRDLPNPAYVDSPAFQQRAKARAQRIEEPSEGRTEQQPRIASMGIREVLQARLAEAGFHYDPWDIACFYTALQTKGFVILAGMSGTGKTKLAQHLAALLSPPHDTGERTWLLVPVRPDWRDSRSLLGYYNPISRHYHWTPTLRLLLRASASFDARDGRAWFLILDEMNLAHVEYYFADLLSVLESGRRTDGRSREPLHFVFPADAQGELPPGELYLPPNLSIVGTVNIDETTLPFSAKVMDRAFSLDLSTVSFEDYPPRLPANVPDLLVPGVTHQALLRAFTGNGRFPGIDKHAIRRYVEDQPQIRFWLQTLLQQLEPYDLHFGYRVFDEIVAFLDHAGRNHLFDGFEPFSALDAAVLMKVLPKFHGPRGQIEEPLLAFLAWCLNPDAPDMETVQNEPAASRAHLLYQFPRTAGRIVRMLARLERTGFVGFAES